MGKKNRNRQNSAKGNAFIGKEATSSVLARKKPEIATFWVAVIIPAICLVGAWTFPPIATPDDLKGSASQIYLAGLLLLWLWMQRDRQYFTLEITPPRICFGLLFLFGTLSVLWAHNPDFWVFKWNKWFAGFVMFLLGLQITQNKDNLSTIMYLSVVAGLITAVIGIAQYLFGFNLLPQTAFPSSTFGNGNMAGEIMILTAFLPLYFLFGQDLSKGKTWFYALSVCLLLAYSFYTRTRSVWIALILEMILILVFLLLDRKRRKDWLHWSRDKTIASVAAFLIFMVLINFNAEGFLPFWEVAAVEISSIVTDIGGAPTQVGSLRYLIWSSALEIIRLNPILGTGLGNYFHEANAGHFLDYHIMGVQRVHNDVLELFVELGVIGMLLFVSIIVTMCIALYQLILGSERERRLFYALLTIAVTGIMFDAQVSFPFQLPVPLVIMPFFVALIVRGYELLENRSRVFTLKPVFNKVALTASAVVFVLITINDLLWMRDFNELNRMLTGKSTETEWKPANPVFNQNYITATRSLAQGLRGTEFEEMSLQVLKPIVEYWPDDLAHQLLLSEIYIKQGNLEQARIWAAKMADTQQPHSYFSEYYLMEVYQRAGDMDGYRAIYESMKDKPDSSLSQHPNTYNMLHSMSINLGDFDRAAGFYEKYLEHWGEFAPVIANQAVYYVNTGNMAEAIPLMRKSLQLDPNIPLAEQFRQLIEQNPGL